MRSFLLLLVAAASPALAQSSDPETRAIVAVIDKLFDGMRTRDTAVMRAAFVPEARMLGLTAQGQLRASSIDSWIASVGRSTGDAARERTWAHQVHVDGGIAQAWMQYDLHIGERFSHCGIDAFDLMKVGGTWKIVTVMDTRRTTGCTQPPPERRQ